MILFQIWARVELFSLRHRHFLFRSAEETARLVLAACFQSEQSLDRGGVLEG